LHSAETTGGQSGQNDHFFHGFHPLIQKHNRFRNHWN